MKKEDTMREKYQREGVWEENEHQTGADVVR